MMIAIIIQTKKTNKPNKPNNQTTKTIISAIPLKILLY
mgnify:CR=1 FL=1